MKRAALALIVLAACAPRTPPKATLVDAQRGNTSLADLEQGRSLLVSKCGSRCHKTPMPNEHTATEWPKALDEMAPRANLDRRQRSAIERYLVVLAQR